MKILSLLAVVVIAALTLSSCATRAPMPTVQSVDLNRFMGDWYVIANIPTFLEREAYNAVESYKLDAKGDILTTFKFNKGSFDGPIKSYSPKGFIRDKDSNAEWGMQFVWPIKADYRIVYLSEDYQRVIIGREARDYVWVMARQPIISDSDYQVLVQEVDRLGYELDDLRKVPQQRLDERK